MPKVELLHWQFILTVLALTAWANPSHGQQVEIQINAMVSDPEPDIATDDYVTWAPTFCRARLVGATSGMTAVLTNDNPAYHLFVSGNNLVDGVLEVGDRFRCQVDSETLEVVASSDSPADIATQIADAWDASTVAEFNPFDAVAEDNAVVITAKSPNDTSNVNVSTVESGGQTSDGQWFLKTTKGDVLFADHQDPWPHNTTATADSVTLSLTSDQQWHPFVIAGRFGRPSTNDKDTSIIAHEGTATGTVRGSKELMVRVRKNANNMGTTERDRFLWAMRGLRNQSAGGFLMFQELHRLATTASDEAHRQPAFFPWHRVFLLQVERALQEIDASVTIPYWDWDEAAPRVFSREFMGLRGFGFGLATPRFSLGHPFSGWSTDLPFSSGAIVRNTRDHTQKPISVGSTPFMPLEPNLVSFPNYSQADIDVANPQIEGDSFSILGERLSHDLGHAWPCGGGHLTRPMRSACDPLFYLLHSQVDRQWAYWQRAQNRFGEIVSGALTFPDHPKYYDNQQAFNTPGNSPAPDLSSRHTRQKGSYLEDGMWPWDGTSNGTPLGVETRPVNKEPPRETGTAQAGGHINSGGVTFGFIRLRSGASPNDHFYLTYVITITGGTGNGQSGEIIFYRGSDQLAVIDRTWSTVPDNTSTYSIDSENIPGSEPSIPTDMFPVSKVRHLWPDSPIVPKVRHTIDYLGRFKPTDGMGFCYDDVPYEAP